MTSASEPHRVTGQPVGLPVDATPAQRPSPLTLEGRYGRVERLAQRHDDALWKAVQGQDHIWTYMSYGPLADSDAFSAWLAGRVKLEDPYSYAIIDRSGQAVAARNCGRRAEGHAQEFLGVRERNRVPGLWRPALANEPDDEDL